jgi:hypothetical protein
VTLHRPMTALIVALALFVPTLAACSNDDDKATSTTTTASSAEDTTAPTEPDDGSTTSAPEPAPFNEGVAAIEAAIENSGGDLCKMLSVFDEIGAVADPATAEEGKRAVDVIVKLFNKLADNAPADLSAQAATIRRGVETIQTEAAQANYDPEVLRSQTGFSVFQDPEFADAMNSFYSLAQEQCADLDLGGGTSDSGGASGN